VFAENIKLELLAKGYYVYPDVMVTCNINDLENDLLIKAPVILVEVLSKSTAVYDLHTKLDYYLKLPSLLYYLVISQTEYQVKVYERGKDAWTYRVVEEKENELHLNQISIRLSLQEIYEDITLEPFQRPS
jgi:Uma2 family endonuclease